MPLAKHASVAAIAAIVGALAIGSFGCSRQPAARPAEPAPPTSTNPKEFDLYAPRGFVQLRWNDAADSTRVLRAPNDAKLRVTATVTGADSLRGFIVIMRLRPETTDTTSAWSFRQRNGCDPAIFVIDANKDAKAPAPWLNKLVLTDKLDSPDGDRLFYAIASYDDVVVNPDSTYSLCHLNLEPPLDADGNSCGWDVPMQISVEVAKLALFGRDVPVKDFGHGLRYEPVVR